MTNEIVMSLPALRSPAPEMLPLSSKIELIEAKPFSTSVVTPPIERVKPSMRASTSSIAVFTPI